MFITPAAYREAARAAANQNPLTPHELIVIKCDEAIREYEAELLALEQAQADRLRRYQAEQRAAIVARHPSVNPEPYLLGPLEVTPERRAAIDAAVIARHPSFSGESDVRGSAGSVGAGSPPSPENVIRRAAARITSLAAPARLRSARRTPQAAGENATTLKGTAK